MQLLNPHEHSSGLLNRQAVPGLWGRSPLRLNSPHPKRENPPPTRHPAEHRGTRGARNPTTPRLGRQAPSGQGRANQIPAQKQK